MQRLPAASAIAEYLLGHPLQNCQFFGALTLAVCIEKGENSEYLYNAIVHSVHAAGSPLVVRRLLADLSLLYIHNHDKFDPVLLLSPRLVLEFLTILAGDLTKGTNLDPSVHIAVKRNVFPHVSKLYESVGSEGLETVCAWMAYVPNTIGEARYHSSDLESIVPYLFRFFAPVDVDDPDSLAVAGKALRAFNEIFEADPSLLAQKEDLYALLFEKWGTDFVNFVLLTDHRDMYPEECNAYVDVVISVLQLTSLKLSKSLFNESTQNILRLALRLADCPGIAIIDERVSDRILVFWEEFAIVFNNSEDVLEAVYRDEPRFEEERERLFTELALVYWRKIHIPAALAGNQSDFFAFRSSVADFFLVVYLLLKIDFYEKMAASLISSVESLDLQLPDIEATLYLLYKINDDSLYFESQMTAIAPSSDAIFKSGILKAFKSIPPEKNRDYCATFVHFLASNEFFFKTDEGCVYLGEVLDFLFPIVMANSSLSLLALKMATKICEECSSRLLEFLPNLEVVVIEVLKNANIDSLIRLRMFNAYSVIARGLETERHGEVMLGMVSAVKDAVESMMASVPRDEEYLTSMLSCLVDIGKGSSLTDEVMDSMSADQDAEYRSYWRQDPKRVKDTIMYIVDLFSLDSMIQKTTTVELCIDVFKCGLGEKLGGPFSLGNEAILNYVLTLLDVVTNPNAVPHIFSLSQALIKIEFRELNQRTVEELLRRTMISKVDFLKLDPDMVASAVSLAVEILKCKPEFVLGDVAHPLFGFCVDALHFGELTVLKAVVKFWVELMSSKRRTEEDQRQITAYFDLGLGQVFCTNLIAAFLKAARSHLDHYYSAFRTLVGQYPLNGKRWLIAALEQNAPLLPKVTEKDLETFLNKLWATRGRRTANEVLKQVWLSANGLIEYNTRSFD